MKIVIIGSGAMGSLFACRLSSLADIVMLGTWSEQLFTVGSSGLLMQQPNGQESLHYFSTTSKPDVVGKSDVVLVLVKTWQTSRAAQQANQVLTHNGIAITLQNGLGNRQVLAAKLGESRVVQGITSEGAMMITPGVVRHAGHGLSHIAAKKGNQSLVSELVLLLNLAGFNTELVESTDSLIWGKLTVNSGINPLSALLQVPNGTLAEHIATRDLMCLAAEETAAVARAQGIPLPYESASDRVVEVAHATAQNRSSMAQDIARGTPTEIDSINGAIIRIGQSMRIETEVNQIFFSLIRSQIETGEWRSRIQLLSDPLKQKFEAILSVNN